MSKDGGYAETAAKHAAEAQHMAEKLKSMTEQTLDYIDLDDMGIDPPTRSHQRSDWVCQLVP